MAVLGSHSIAANYNVALLSLANIARIRPTNDIYFWEPMVIGHGSPGLRKRRLNGLGFLSGYSYVEWLFAVMTRLQYEYWHDTLLGGAFSGKVTVYTTVSGIDYARYNAIADLPETAAIPNAYYAYQNVPIRFSHLVPI